MIQSSSEEDNGTNVYIYIPRYANLRAARGGRATDLRGGCHGRGGVQRCRQLMEWSLPSLLYVSVCIMAAASSPHGGGLQQLTGGVPFPSPTTV
eukprot:COSAG02_NODE_75_length_41389_cov_106.665762_9_plen_94_part_00